MAPVARMLAGTLALAGLVGVVASGALPTPWPLVAAALARPGQEPSAGSGVTQEEDERSEEVERRIESLRSELERLAGERESVVTEFETADVELALRREQLSMLARREEHLAGDIEQQQRQVAELEGELEDGLAMLRARAVSLYRIGPLSYNRLLLAAESSRDALVAYQLITYLTARDRDLVEATRATIASLEQARERLAATEARLAEIRADVTRFAARLEAQQRERRDLLRQLDRQAEARRVALAEAERAAARLEETMADLAEPAEAAPATFAASRGRLPWPVEGPVVGDFGRVRHPVYDTYTISRGIEIEAEEGEPVLAVHPGKVVFADWYSGYGLLVILDHGGGYFSLYGHLSEIDVRVNRRVETGDIVGRVGETASLTGPNLYFEVRENTDALNPRQWLGER